MRKHVKDFMFVLLVIGSFFLLFGATVAMPKSLSQQVIEKLTSLPPGKNLTVKMGILKDQYSLGERFEIRFIASQKCYLTLIDIDAEGKITFLVPSRYAPADKIIQGGRVYSTGTYPHPDPNSEEALYDLGISLTVSAPAGTDVLYLCCSTRPVEWFKPDELGKDGVYTIMPDDETRLKALLARLDGFTRSEWGDVEWAGAGLNIEIGAGSGVQANVLLPGGRVRSGRWFPPIGATGTTGVEDDRGDERGDKLF
jgi:hypothetical protein